MNVTCKSTVKILRQWEEFRKHPSQMLTESIIFYDIELMLTNTIFWKSIEGDNQSLIFFMRHILIKKIQSFDDDVSDRKRMLCSLLDATFLEKNTVIPQSIVTAAILVIFPEHFDISQLEAIITETKRYDQYCIEVAFEIYQKMS